ncbi:thiol oxidoreductase [Dyadobacter sp. CY261]|uniref:di-heme oxidoreductase family protein n=1 Tax=Dyadobacter sp. CY261 TaxID=2907203 RepID=UPI001F379FF7|nr:di-heme oxidoredictase family protein [Dyadobacter sp. CY261]MCF0072955.1 thiol oxidoreductase [Dyadobacter sp. CY261]
MITRVKISFWVCLVGLMLVQCKHDDDVKNEPVAEEDEAFSGGQEGTVFDHTANAFGNALTSLTSPEVDRFVIGNSFNRNNWVTAPSSTSARDGLGPLFNASSCSACHFQDGRGAPVSASDQQITQALLFRLSIPGQDAHGGPLFDPNYGEQFNPRAVIGALAEGDVAVTYTEMPGTYPDGTPFSLRKPTYTFSNQQYGPMTGTLVSPRIAPQMSGVGLLEIVPEQTILSFADDSDNSHDGISGRPNYVWDFRQNKKVLGRFGWKANQPTVEQQSGSAFNGDLGVTSPLFMNEGLTAAQLAKYGALPNGGRPEITDSIFEDVVFYIRALAVPARRDWKDQQVLAGRELFAQAHCTGCHIPKMLTGKTNSPSYLSAQTIRPYTDLLLHDMGEDLADHRPDFEATGTEWRTPPLWGLGLIRIVNKHTFLLHDGRARNAEEAILWHGGEAEVSKKAFMNYSKTEREALLRFIDSL